MKTKMKKTIKIALALAVTTGFIFFSCKKKKGDPVPQPTTTGNPAPNEQEIITTMRLIFTDGTTTATYQFKDPDGDGGISPFYGPGTNSTSTQSDSVINLTANKSYTLNLLLLDETKIPVDTISNEVFEEGADHMIFFNQLSPTAPPSSSVTIAGTNLSIVYLDTDGASNPLPVGLLTKWVTGFTSPKKEILIELKHQPGTKNGTYSPGDVDVAVPFKIKIN